MKPETIIGLGLIGVLVWQIAKPRAPARIVTGPTPPRTDDGLFKMIGRGAKAVGEGLGSLFEGRQRKTARCRRYANFQMEDSDIDRRDNPEEWGESHEEQYDACMDNPSIASGIV